MQKVFNNYKATAITTTFLLLFFFSYGQAPYDSTRLLQKNLGYGFDWGNAKFKSIVIPTDTVKMAYKDSGSIAYKGSYQWSWNGIYWEQTNVKNVGARYPIRFDSINNTLYFDTSYNRVVKHGDSLFVRNGVGDSLFVGKMGGGTVGSTGRVYSGYGLANVNDSTLRADSLLLKTVFQSRQDSIALRAAIAAKLNSIDSTTYGGYYPWSNPLSFLRSYTETDPIYSASSWFGTINNSTNWNTAFSWGNHASANYLRKTLADSSYLDSAYTSYGTTEDSLKYRKNGISYTFGFVYHKDGLLSGGVVTWSGAGLTYNVTAAVYYINQIRYTSAAGSITLAAADATNPRKDVITLDNTGTIVALTGIAAVNPQEPQTNPSTQIDPLTTVDIAANAITPTGVSETLVYDENVEWVGSASGVTANFASTTTPFRFTKTTDLGAFINGNFITYTNTSTIPNADYSSVKFYVKLKSVLSNTANIRILFLNGNTVVSNTLTVGAAQGFNKSNVGTYQNISIPISLFSFTNANFDKLRIIFAGSNTLGLYIDYVSLQKGVSTGTSANYITNLYRKAGSDSVFKVINNLSVFSFRDSIGSSVTSAALTKTDDTNITLTLGGSPSTALLQATSLTLGWNGLLADSRIASATNWNTAYTNRITGLTTTGNSGAASLTSNVLNIPNYTLAGLGGISLTSLSATGAGLTYNNTTGLFTIGQSTTSTTGALSSTDWNTFNNKQAQLNGTGFVKASGTTISYDNTTYKAATDTSAGNSSGYTTGYTVQKKIDSLQNNINTKLSITDTANMRFRPIAGTNITITGTYPNLTLNGAASGVTSFNSRTGAVVPLVGDYSTFYGSLSQQNANTTAITQKVDTGGAYLKTVTLTNSGLIHGTPTYTYNSSTHNYDITQTLASQTPYTLLGRASGTGVPSWLTSIDSNWIPSLHSQTYYDARYTPTFLKNTARDSIILTFNGGRYAVKDSTGGGGSGWGLTGNAGTVAGTNFIGTTDNIALVFKTNNTRSGEINPVTGNVFLGYASGITSTGSSNTGMGIQTLNSNTTGTGNTALGYQSLFSNTSGLGNISIGRAMVFSNASNNIGIGNGVLNVSSGGNNVGIGYPGTLNANSTGLYNTAVGGSGLSSNSTGSYNCALGSGLRANTSGNNNLGIGQQSLDNSTTGDGNVGLGYQASFNNITGGYNVAIGSRASFSNTGVRNVAIGNDVALNRISNGGIYLGSYAGKYAGGGDNEIVINSIDRGTFSGDQTGSPIYVQQNATLTSQKITLNGVVGINITTPAASAALDITSTTAGVLIPRMTTTNMNAISIPATGLQLFNTDAGATYEYSGTQFKSIGTLSGSFSGTGTASTTFTVTFGGTQPNATYKVNVTPTNALSAASLYVISKTTTSFTVTYLTGLTGTVSFDWSLFQ